MRVLLCSSSQLIQKRPCVLHIGRIETLGEPIVEWTEQITGLRPSALVAPKPGEVDRRPQPGKSRLLPAALNRSTGSGRASSEACNFAGTDNAKFGTGARAVPRYPDSNTDFVSSSMNSGTPSLRSVIFFTISDGNAACPATLRIIVAVSRRSSLARLSIVTFGSPIHGG